MANWQKRNKWKQAEKEKQKGAGAGANPFRSTLSLKEQLEWTEQRVQEEEKLDRDFGYATLTPGPSKLGFLLHIAPTTATDRETGIPKSAVALYFLQGDGAGFKCVVPYEPYFYIYVKDKYFTEVEEFIRRTYSKEVSSVMAIDKEDLELVNHLSGAKRRYMKISFLTVQALLSVRGKLMSKVSKNRRRLGVDETYSELDTASARDEGGNDGNAPGKDFTDFIYDLREYDVTYYQRFAVDKGIRVGLWYMAAVETGSVALEKRSDLMDRARMKVLAFDIETTHAPMRFPDSEVDCITMISFMLDQQGYLIVNRELVSEDVRDFEYSPKPEFYGPFKVFNEANEAALLRRFYAFARAEKPHIYVSFNGDTFDWPFVEARSKVHGLSMADEIGMRGDKNDEYRCHYASHMDCYKWVVRDSYLPAGSQGLKAVTKAKLGYDPLELDPEDMVKFATEQPQTLASYSVSDAVATYYLYQNYVQPFIFSLCTIIPMCADDVLRKGSGTLCEALLMVQATAANIVYPNKSQQQDHKMHEGHLIETETYIGGHVESLAAGLFRADIPMAFQLDVPTLDLLLGQLDSTLRFAIETSAKGQVADVANYDEVRDKIAAALTALRDRPVRSENPLIYHLDVGAMYPNIILTNRLQPSAIVDERTCAGCDFNKPANQCQKKVAWTWRGDLFPTNRSEYELVKSQLESEKFANPHGADKPSVSYFQLPYAAQQLKLKQRLKDYSRRVYKKTHITVTEERIDTVCMRENSFYVDTVRLFRDRRYEYKADWTAWKAKLARAQADGNGADIIKAKEMVVIYESLQIAHKCILNSFYGYVMRRGARWFSMTMAGMVTKTGAEIIRRTRELVERVGIPLELDTDGIWCVLPCSFPENFQFVWRDPKRKPVGFSYSCEVLNHMVNREFTNYQYQDLVDGKRYVMRPENSIFFEVDGPYRAMVLPASSEEGKTLKKRYAVFRHDGSLAELKGFELKRRGELNLIKIFQGKVFETFLRGDSLEAAYREVAKVADQWLDVLFNKGRDMDDDELVDLLSSSSSMSKSLSEYGETKSNAITTAKRLGEFLGPQMVANKGLACKFVISREPAAAPVTERAIPVIIFSADSNTRNYFIRKWIRDTSRTYSDYSIRDILDWDYYIARFGKTLQKICTIPAAMQGVANPLPRVADPEWLRLKKRIDADPRKQLKIEGFFARVEKPIASEPRTPMAGTPRKPAFSAESPSKSAALTPVVAVKKVAVAASTVDAPVKGRNYVGWLQRVVKPQWTRQWAERKSSSSLSSRLVIHNYEQRARFRFACYPWHVLQVLEADVVGEFDVWALVGSEGMRKLRLRGQRRVLVSSASDSIPALVSAAPDWSVRKVALALPHSKPAPHLFEVTLPEATFQRTFARGYSLATAVAAELDPTAHMSSSAASSLSSSLLLHDAVYETKTSLLFNTLLDVGAVVEVDIKALALDMDRGGLPKGTFLPSHLTRRNVAPGQYAQQLDTIFVYHSCNRDQSRGVFGVHLPDARSEVHFILYGPQRSDVANVEKRLAHHNRERTYRVRKVTRRDLACRQLDKLLAGQHALAFTTPTVLALQTTVTDAQLALEVPSLAHFPTVRLIPNEHDNAYEQKSNWEIFAVNCFMMRQLHVAAWLEKQLAFAAYAQIPLANFRAESPSLVSDVFLQRALKRNGMVAWASDTTRPDLGGAEEDNNIILVDLENPELTHAGCYDVVCIELSLYNLAVDAILQSHLINVAEGSASAPVMTERGGASSAGVGGAGGGVVDPAEVAAFDTFDDTSDCVPAFQVLKAVVTQWTNDIGSTRETYNEWAETLLNNVYHWVSSPQSKTYDPALHRLVHLMMRKVFLQLLHELKKLGSRIVYASFNQIIIATNKHTVADAKTYWEFISKTLVHNELFTWLSFEPTAYWEVLLFSEVSNYGGVQAAEGDDGGAAAPPKVVSNWNVADYLPAPLDQSFMVTVSEYLLSLRERARRRGASAGGSGDAGAAVGDDDEGGADESLISSALTQRLLATVAHVNNSPAQTAVQRALPGAIATAAPQSLALQFVRTVCHVLALDKRNAEGVYSLRRSLLRLIGVDDFAKAAEFVDPAPSYVLQDVICSFCSYPHNMDLLRDPLLLNHDWSCKQRCGHVYSKGAIESLLVERVYQLSYAYQAQDMVCVKCRLVKAENMTIMCPSCSGAFAPRTSAADMMAKLETMRQIAKFHDMQWLQAVVAESIQ